MGHHGFPRRLLPAAGSESGEKKLVGPIQSHWEVLVGWTHGPGAGGPPWKAQPNRGQLSVTVHTLPAGRGGPSSPAPASGRHLLTLPAHTGLFYYLLNFPKSIQCLPKVSSFPLKCYILATNGSQQPLQRNAVETAWPLGSGWVLVPGWVRLLGREGSHLLLRSP